MSLERTIFIFLISLVLTGCGGDGFNRIAVSGKVLFDGQPVPLGDLSFVNSETGPGGNRPQTFARIVNGEFSIPRERGPIPGAQTARVVFLEEVKRPVDPSNSEQQAETALKETGFARINVELPAGGDEPLIINLTKQNKMTTEGNSI